MRVVFTENSWADYIYWQKEDKKLLKKEIELALKLKKPSIKKITHYQRPNPS